MMKSRWKPYTHCMYHDQIQQLQTLQRFKLFLGKPIIQSSGKNKTSLLILDPLKYGNNELHDYLCNRNDLLRADPVSFFHFNITHINFSRAIFFTFQASYIFSKVQKIASATQYKRHWFIIQYNAMKVNVIMYSKIQFTAITAKQFIIKCLHA